MSERRVLRMWFPNGNPWYEISFVKDVRDGPYKVWDDTGFLYHEAVFKEGICVTVVEHIRPAFVAGLNRCCT
jgi:antitoxin component YwqK of YwqJK toxin-antitoxin module